MAIIRPWWTDKDGARRQASTLTVQFRDHRGVKRRYATGSTTLSVAKEHERRLIELRDVAGASAPIPDHLSKWLERQSPSNVERLCEWGMVERSRVLSGQTLRDHIDAFENHLKDAGAGTAEQTSQRVRRVVEWCGWTHWSDVRASDFMRFRAHLRDSESLGPQTRNHYLAAAKQFFAWLEADGRCGASPLAHAKRERVRDDVRRRRRSISLDEFQRLLNAAAAQPVFLARDRHGATVAELTGPERALLYWFAGHTGMRRGEIESLQRSDITFADGLAIVRPRKTKTDTGADQPMPVYDAGLVAALRRSVKGKAPAAPLLRVPPKNYSASMLRRDLAPAEIPYKTDDGYFDFHALRHFADSQLKRHGVPLDIVKRRMRHANMAMTLDTYGLANMTDELSVLRSLPTPVPPAILVEGA